MGFYERPKDSIIESKYPDTNSQSQNALFCQDVSIFVLQRVTVHGQYISIVKNAENYFYFIMIDSVSGVSVGKSANQNFCI